MRNDLANYRKSTSLLYLSLVVAICVGSRSATIGLFVSILYVSWFYLMRELKYAKTVAILSVVFLLGILVFFVKGDSSQGRMLIYKISFPIFRDNWLWGIGSGNLKGMFLNYQADYFEKGAYSQKELLLAGNTYHVFNEYYELVLEAGVLVVVPMLLVLVFLWSLINYALANSRDIANVTASGFLIALLVYSLFNYSFSEYGFVLYFFLFALVLLACFRFAWTSKQKNGILLFLSIIFMADYGYIYLQAAKLDGIDQLHKAGMTAKATEQLNGLHVTSKALYPKYLDLKSSILVKRGDWANALAVTEELVNLKPSNLVLMRMGWIYEQTGDLGKAEYCLKRAVLTVPNRFLTRHGLFQFYLRNGKNDEALACGKELLALPEKIPSELISHIKNNVKTKSVTL